MNKKLEGKDLMNIGIYTAIYFVIVFAVAMLGYIPILMLLLCVFVPLIGGIPFMLYLTKVKKFGMIWIMSILMGILMLLTGMSYHAIFVGAISGLIAEFVFKSGNYEDSNKAVITCGFFSMWVWGNFIPIFLDSANYWSSRQEFGKEYIETMNQLTPTWMLGVLLICSFVFGIIGGLLGKKLLKKHFRKSGIV